MKRVPLMSGFPILISIYSNTSQTQLCDEHTRFCTVNTRPMESCLYCSFAVLFLLIFGFFDQPLRISKEKEAPQSHRHDSIGLCKHRTKQRKIQHFNNFHSPCSPNMKQIDNLIVCKHSRVTL